MSIIDTNVKSLAKTIYFDDFLKLGTNINANGDYSGNIVDFIYTNHSTTETLFIGQLNIKIVNSSITFNDYVGIGSVLANGIKIYYTTNSGLNKNYIINAYPIIKTTDYYNYATETKIIDNNTGNIIFNVNLDFQRNYSNIKLGENETFGVELNDDFRLLTEQTFTIIGFTYPSADLL